jgi:hypothetical protein
MVSLVSNPNFVIVTSYAKAAARIVHRLVLDLRIMRIGAFLALRSGKLETTTTASPEFTALANKEAEAIGLDLNTEFSPETENKLPLDEGLKALVSRQMNETWIAPRLRCREDSLQGRESQLPAAGCRIGDSRPRVS